MDLHTCGASTEECRSIFKQLLFLPVAPQAVPVYQHSLYLVTSARRSAALSESPKLALGRLEPAHCQTAPDLESVQSWLSREAPQHPALQGGTSLLCSMCSEHPQVLLKCKQMSQHASATAGTGERVKCH